MGGLLSRGAPTSASAAVRTVPAAAHKADAIAKAAVAKSQFPPMPTLPPQPGSPQPLDELEANKNVTSWLAQTSFATREQPTGGAATSGSLVVDVADPEVPTGVPLDDVLDALRLHGEDAAQWTAPTLAQRYGISDVDTLANALAHVRTYRVLEDEEGRARGVAVGDEAPRTVQVQDLFAAEFAEGDAEPPTSKPPSIPPPSK